MKLCYLNHEKPLSHITQVVNSSFEHLLTRACSLLRNLERKKLRHLIGTSEDLSDMIELQDHQHFKEGQALIIKPGGNSG